MNENSQQEKTLFMTRLMTPDMSNFSGKVHGGTILKLLDEAAFTCASRYCKTYVVTKSLDQVVFKNPIAVGDLITFKCNINYVGKTSMEVGVRVEGEKIKDKIKRPRRPVVVYEILPPRKKDGTLNSYAANISSLLSQTHIDAINIPEVHAEKSRGERPVEEKHRSEPREFGRLLQDTVGIEAIINRVTVMKDKEKQNLNLLGFGTI